MLMRLPQQTKPRLMKEDAVRARVTAGSWTWPATLGAAREQLCFLPRLPHALIFLLGQKYLLALGDISSRSHGFLPTFNSNNSPIFSCFVVQANLNENLRIPCKWVRFLLSQLRPHSLLSPPEVRTGCVRVPIPPPLLPGLLQREAGSVWRGNGLFLPLFHFPVLDFILVTLVNKVI